MKRKARNAPAAGYPTFREACGSNYRWLKLAGAAAIGAATLVAQTRTGAEASEGTRAGRADAGFDAGLASASKADSADSPDAGKKQTVIEFEDVWIQGAPPPERPLQRFETRLPNRRNFQQRNEPEEGP